MFAVNYVRSYRWPYILFYGQNELNLKIEWFLEEVECFSTKYTIGLVDGSLSCWLLLAALLG